MKRKTRALYTRSKKIIALMLSVAMVLSMAAIQSVAAMAEELENATLITEEVQNDSESTVEGNQEEGEDPTAETGDVSSEQEDNTENDSDVPAEEEVTGTASIGKNTYDTLQQALNAAEEGDTVRLHEDVTESVVIRKAITLDLRGHSVTGSSTYAVCINGASAKVMNGTIKDTKASNGAGMTVSRADAVIENIKIIGNTATGGYGGGLYVTNSHLTMRSCEVSDNASAGYGSGICLVNSQLEGDNLKIENNVFTGIESYARGGAIYVYDAASSVNLKNSVLSGNEAGYGGAVYSGGSVTMENCTVKDNAAHYRAGGIYADTSSEVSMTGGTMSGNSAGSNGGALYLTGSTAELKNITVEKNSGTNGGAIYIANAASAANMKNSVLRENEADYGGAVYSMGAVTMENCTVKDNEAYYCAGGVYVDASKVSMTGGTVSGNSADSSGGGFYLSGGSSAADLKDVTIEKNSSASGGGINSYGTITMENCTVSENSATSGNGGGIASWNSYSAGNVTITGGSFSKNSAASWGGGMYVLGVSATIKDVEIKENAANAGGGINLSVEEAASVENVVFTANTGKTGAAVSSRTTRDEAGATVFKNCTFVKNGSKECESIVTAASLNHFENCTFTENTGEDGSIVYCYGYGTETVLVNCLLEKNISKTATVYVKCDNTNQGAELRNTVIRYNEATGTEYSTTGGVSVFGKGYLRILSGAVYENISGADTGASDLYLSAKSTVDIIKADAMEDGEASFAGYTWYDDVNYINEKEALVSDSTSDRYFTAGKYDDRVIAQIGEETFTSLQAAVNAAKAGDTIVIIASLADGNKTLNIKPVHVDKNLTIDLNNHAVWIRGGSGLSVSEGKLKLTGEGTVHGTVSTTAQGQLSVAEGVCVDKLALSGKSARLDMAQEALELILGAGSSASLGETFSAENLTVELDSAVLSKLNGEAFLEENIVLLTGVSDKALLDKITIKGLKNPLVQLVLKDGNAELQKKELKGVYLDGVKGSDSADGLSKAAPVKTFEKAKEILNAHEELDTIYIMGTVMVKGEASWSLQDGRLMRYPEYADTLISVPDGNKLSLVHITIDGASSYGLDTAKPMISVRGSLHIGDDTVLQNNYAVKASGVSARGGAIQCDGLLTMDGGVIRNCSAMYGGAIFLYGDSTFTMNDGLIENNFVKGKTGDEGQGGAVMISYNAKMIMNGGMLRANRSEIGSGGAISVGGLVYENASSLLKINGGDITENQAYVCGGGVYVECNSVAIVNEAAKSGNLIHITNNSCGDSRFDGWFGGGGIYVNGGVKGYENGKLYAYNVAVYDNTAAGAEGEIGGGFAGCGTSNTKLYLSDGGVFYGNKNNEGVPSDILCSNIDHATGVGSMFLDPKSYISEYMLGGGAYHWRNSAEEEVSLYGIHASGTHYLHTNLTAEDKEIEKAMSLAGVFIAGNTSNKRGGGIGSNGDVIIGHPDESEDLCEVKATKVWNDDDNQRELRPESIKIWLVRNGEKVTYQICKPDENGTWPEVVFDNQPVSDENGKPYDYTVEEDRQGIDAHYKSSVEKVDDVWVITNTYKPTIPQIPEEPENPEDPPEPPTEIDEPSVPFVPGPPTEIDEPDVPLAPGPGDDDLSQSIPKTGDDASMLTLLGLLAVSMTCLGFAVYKKRKSTEIE